MTQTADELARKDDIVPTEHVEVGSCKELRSDDVEKNAVGGSEMGRLKRKVGLRVIIPLAVFYSSSVIDRVNIGQVGSMLLRRQSAC